MMRRRLLRQALAGAAGLRLAPLAPIVPGVGLGVGIGGGLGTGAAVAAPTPDDGPIGPQRRWRWPRDHGAHPSTAIEWWYLTGWLSTDTRPDTQATQATQATRADSAAAQPSPRPSPPTHGFQITFFRSRTGLDGQGRWAPRQLLFAHAALTTLGAPDTTARAGDASGRDDRTAEHPRTARAADGPGTAAGHRGGRHRHAQRVMRWNGDPALPEAHAALDDTRLRLGPWWLRRTPGPTPGTPAGVAASPGGASRYEARLMAPAEGFGLALTLDATQPLLLQGQDGWSRKGPRPQQASCYLTEPQLRVEGQLSVDGRSQAVHGRAWLDHEWSDSLLDPAASGWDWIGINLDDGAALTAFRLRQPDERTVWGGGSWRAPGGPTRAFGPDALDWQPLRVWRSPATGIRYPVAWRLSSRAPLVGLSSGGDAGRERLIGRSADAPPRRPGAWTADGRLQVEVHALLDAQELDSRASTGAIYWEGLVELREPTQGRRLGLGYLEMTGRGERLKLGG